MNGECCDPSLAVLFSVPPDFVTPAARTYNWVIHRVWRKGRERSVEKAAQPKGQDFCGCRPGCKKFLNLWVGDRVRRSEGRGGGNECVSTFRCRWGRCHENKKETGSIV